MRNTVVSVLAVATFSAALAAQGAPYEQRARDIYKELIEINTTDTPAGNVTKAAEAMAARLKAAGFPEADIHVLGPDPKKHNLVVRYRGTGARKPLLLLAHIDVVEAKREDWSFDPFVFLEKDGFFYGRGTSDDKAMASQFVADLIRLKEEHFVPERDLILALTADEEGGDFDGAEWLVNTHRDLVDAEFAINEGGGGNMRKGKYLTNEVQASEKVYQDFTLKATNAGGHSSMPVKDNAIYHLTAALDRLSAFTFPLQLNDVTRTYFERSAMVETDPAVAADMRAVAKAVPNPAAAARLAARLPYWNSMMHTTCVATHARRRPREERAAADGVGQRQLPDPARDDAGVGEADAHLDVCRSEGRGRIRPGGASERDGGHAPRRPVGGRVADESHVPRRRCRAGDEHGRDRRPLLPQRRHPDVRDQRHVRRHGRRARARA